MRAQGFQGGLYPINPNRAEVQGLKAYPSIADLPETPDVAIVAVAAEVAAPAVEDLGKRGVKAIVMFTAGFAEMDEAGEVAQTKMVATARSYGMRILGPNCLGVFDARRVVLRDIFFVVRQWLAGAWAASASPASPALMARIFTRWRATAASAPRCA